ncbi:amidohydrolase [Mobilicoccus caccae]|nr:amidohydrolase family protein [Mobilicoccus caccae]
MPTVAGLHSVRGTDDDGIDLGLDLGLTTGLGDDHLRIGAMKIWLDGSLIARTAAMTQDYACRCNPDHPAGYLQDDADTMRRQILAAIAGGWDIAAHAIGDAAVDFALDVFEEAASSGTQTGRRPRHRIEHAGITSDSQITRMARLDVTPVPQMRFLREFGDDMATSMGPERAKLLYRHKSFLDAGLRVPGSSDRPVAEGAPLLAMATMQDRLSESGVVLGPDERVDAVTALRAYTVDAAWIARDEDRRGALTPGRLADLVVLDTDISRAAPEDVAATTVLATVLDGLATHDTGIGLPVAPPPA